MELFTTDFFQKVNTLKLAMLMRLSAGTSGARKSTAKGTSVEFSDFREYMLGDDIRRIDWNAYGRFDKLYIKEFMEEKEGLYNIFIDTSKSMDFGEKKKSEMALKIAGALSYLVLGNLDRVYVNELKEDAIRIGKGLSGRNAWGKIAKELGEITFDGKTTLSSSILRRNIKVRGVSIIISDFFDREGIEGALKYLAYKKQQIVLVQVLSREEINVDYEGALNLIDSEDGSNVKLTMNRQAVKEYEDTLEKHVSYMKGLAIKYQASYVQAVSDESIEKVLFDSMIGAGLILRK